MRAPRLSRPALTIPSPRPRSQGIFRGLGDPRGSHTALRSGRRAPSTRPPLGRDALETVHDARGACQQGLRRDVSLNALPSRSTTLANGSTGPKFRLLPRCAPGPLGRHLAGPSSSTTSSSSATRPTARSTSTIRRSSAAATSQYPHGLPGVEDAHRPAPRRRVLRASDLAGTLGRISRRRRQFVRIYPQKGAIEVGADGRPRSSRPGSQANDLGAHTSHGL